MFGLGNKSMGDTNDLISYVVKGDYYKTKLLIDSKGYSDRELNSISDSYGNNLLHLATMASNCQMVEYFLDKGICFTKQNNFKQTPWDLATASKNSDIVDKFVLYRIRTENHSTVRLNELESERDELQAKNRELKRLNGGLETTNAELVTKYNLRNRDVIVLQTENNDLKTSNKRLKSEVSDLQAVNYKLHSENKTSTSILLENSELKSSNKRLRDEVGELKSTNKRLRDENDVLVEKNAKLKTSVENLMNSTRK